MSVFFRDGKETGPAPAGRPAPPYSEFDNSSPETIGDRVYTLFG